MKVKCIYNKGLEKWLTIGKTYDLIDEDDNSLYCIINDINNRNWFYKK